MSFDFEKVKAVFHAAVERHSPADRDHYLDAACTGDPVLRHEVMNLLRAHLEGGSLLDVPLVAVNGRETATLIAEGPGSTIDCYKLLEKIGEGGFGTVFLAEQERPVRRRVALKIIKPGMDTREVIARFEVERQALAMMDHPNIAQVFDAGATENGRPYFVMELVQGVPITEYCDECNLTTRERLELFIAVCQAVQHAHQKGVIHRDIKPTNVLVAMQDGKAAPKIIDFGVVKALNQRLTEHTLDTGFAQMIGTPLYMSPEQAELSPLGVDTRSDIYSLGVLLYELLTGTTPLDKDRLHAAGYEELRRILREVDPPRPSSRLSTLAAHLATTVAERRRTDARRLLQTVRGELDWIAMKCLEKDRNRRYASASAVAQDVERYLADEPVEACPPSAAYRLGKFARRNRAALTVALAIVTTLLLLVAGLAVSNRLIAASRNETVAALRQREQALAGARASAAEAESQRQRAEESSRKALTAVRDLLTSPAISHNEWSQIPNPVRRKFRDEAAKFYAGLAAGKNADPALRYETAIGQRALGFLYQQTDGPEQAESLLRESVGFLEELHRESPGNSDYRRQLAKSHDTLFHTLWWLRRMNEAEASAARSIELYEELMAERADFPGLTDEVYDTYVSRGTLLWGYLGRADDAERMYLRAIEIHEQHAARAFTPSDRARAYEALSGLLIRLNRKEDAADICERGLKLNPNDTRRWYGAAALYLSSGDVDRYRGACGELLNRAEKVAASNPNVADWAVKTCALAPDSVPDFSRVERLAQRIVTDTENHPWRRNFILAKALTDYRGGHHQEAIEWLQQFGPRTNGEHFDATAFAALALAHHHLGHNDQARASLKAAQAIIASKPPDALSGAFWFDWLHCEILCREAETFAE